MTELATRAAGKERLGAADRVREFPYTLYVPLALATGLTLVAFLIRIYRIDHESLWLDEGYTLLFSHLPLARLFVVGGSHEHPPFFYLLVHLLLAVHDSYLVARIISAVAGSLSVLALYALGTRLYGRSTGALAAGLLAVSPFHVWYSQDARGYELAGLMVLLSYLSLWHALGRRYTALWLAYAGCTALALYTEYTTVLVLIPQGLLYLRARRDGIARPLLLSWLGTGLAFLPWLGTLVLDAVSISGQYWIPSPTPASVVQTILEFLGLLTPCPSPPCKGVELRIATIAGHEPILAALVVVTALGVLILAVRRRDLDLAVLGVWLTLPFVLVLLIATTRSLYLDRVFLDATFPLYLLVGAAASGAMRLRSVRLAAAVLSVLLALAGLQSVSSIYAGGINPDWRSATRDFYRAYRPGQAVVFHPAVIRRLVSAYIPPGWRATRERPLWYRSYLDVPGWEARYGSLTDAELRDRQLTSASAGRRQVWLVTQDYTGLNDTRRWFVEHGFQPVLSQIYRGDTRIELWDRRPPTDFGPVVVQGTFGPAWARSGAATVANGVAREMGPGALTRRFPVVAGIAYSVNLEYFGVPPAGPSVSLTTYDRAGHPVGGFVDRLGHRLDGFPRTEWFALPVNGVWLSQPFGFVAPPGAVSATIRLRNRWGWTLWRHIGVYRER